MNTFDVIIVGAGQAGPALAGRLAAAGRRVALIEQRHFGGTCVNNGCTPTKTLVASARVAHLARRAAEYGIRLTGEVGVDMARIKARKDELVLRSRDGQEHWLESLANVALYREHARFLDAHTLAAGPETLRAERIFLDVGGRPTVPDFEGLRQVRYLTNETMMDVDFLPEHLLVVGGSYVGLEFAQMYRRFGSRVTVIEMGSRLVSREDPDVSEAIRDILAAEGIDIRLDSTCIAFDPAGEGVHMRLDCRQGAPQVLGSHVLLAVGRTPNTEDLGLERAGVEIDARGYIKVDDTLRTSVPHIYALGDCNGRGAFTHTAWNDHEIVAANLLDGEQRKVSDRIPIYGLFIDPPLGCIGLTESEARRSGRALLLGKMPMSEVARARENGETGGFMKVIVDAGDRRILGAAVLGAGGDEAVQSLLDAMNARLPYTEVERGVRIHPTVSELIPTLLGRLEPLPYPARSEPG